MKLGALPPEGLDWQIGKTAAAIALVNGLIGMSERSAVRKIENARYIARVISRDGVQRITPGDDKDDERVNLVVEQSEVKEAWIG